METRSGIRILPGILRSGEQSPTLSGSVHGETLIMMSPPGPTAVDGSGHSLDVHIQYSGLPL